MSTMTQWFTYHPTEWDYSLLPILPVLRYGFGFGRVAKQFEGMHKCRVGARDRNKFTGRARQ